MIKLLFFLIVIIVSIVSNSKKQNNGAMDTENTPSLDDIFNEAMRSAANKRSSGNGAGNSNRSSARQPQRKNTRQERSPSRESLTRATANHDDHDCEEVNYDKMDSLMGKEGSFNLASKESAARAVARTDDFKMSRDDLLKSFIMSEVLQRYDINRIYSRIPPVKSDD